MGVKSDAYIQTWHQTKSSKDAWSQNTKATYIKIKPALYYVKAQEIHRAVFLKQKMWRNTRSLFFDRGPAGRVSVRNPHLHFLSLRWKVLATWPSSWWDWPAGGWCSPWREVTTSRPFAMRLKHVFLLCLETR